MSLSIHLHGLHSDVQYGQTWHLSTQLCSGEDWSSASVVNHSIVTNPTVQQPGFDVLRHTWSLLNLFRAGQGPCHTNLHKWGLAWSPCGCGQRQTMNHIVDTCPLTKFEDRPKLLHEVDDDTVVWLKSTETTALAKWMKYDKWYGLLLQRFQFKYYTASGNATSPFGNYYKNFSPETFHFWYHMLGDWLLGIVAKGPLSPTCQVLIQLFIYHQSLSAAVAKLLLQQCGLCVAVLAVSWKWWDICAGYCSCWEHLKGNE